MIRNIQALRAFAALNVVVFHALELAGRSGLQPRTFAFLEGWGRNGVDVFFVISGFIMVYIQERRPRAPLAFLLRRAERIAPLYWSVTLPLVIALPFSWRHGLTSLLFLSGAAGYDFPVIVPGWSLEYEMLFYLVFGLSLFAPGRAASLAAALTAVVVLVLAGWARPVALEFAFGMAAGRAFVAGLGRTRARLWLALGAFGLLASLPFDPPLELRWLVWGVPSFFLVLGAAFENEVRSPLLGFLGDASYSIYLVHLLVVQGFYELVRLFGTGSSGWGADLLVLACVVTAAGVGGQVFCLYERPLGRRLRRWMTGAGPSRGSGHSKLLT